MVSSLDKKWMNPQLKTLLRKTKREFYKKRKSPKWRKLKKKYTILKRKTVQNFYSYFVCELKTSHPAKWYSMAKRQGAEESDSDGVLLVECLKRLYDQDAAERVAEFFSWISKEYSPLDTSKLPAYLPAPHTLRVNDDEVAERIFLFP